MEQKSPQNRWNEEEKSNQKHDMCEAGEQDERNQQEAGEQKGGAEDTCDCDSESHSIPWSRARVQEKYSHDESKTGWEREVQGDGQHCTTGGGPNRCGSTGWALGEKEVGGSFTCHAVNLSLKGLKLQSESSDERDELLATLAP